MRHRLIILAAATAALATTAGTVESSFTSVAKPGRSTFDAAATFAPRNLTLPAITGRAKEGETLTATNGTWARGTTSITITWLRCTTDGACTPVGSGTTRELAAADVGNRLRVTAQATNAGGTATATSSATDTVIPMDPPTNTALPTVAGSTTVGGTLTATDGTWSGDRLTLARRWFRCSSPTFCLAIPSETDTTYELTGDDAGATIKLEVTASNERGTATKTAVPTATIERATYTQILCANPDTGAGVGADGGLPNGMTVDGTLGSLNNTSTTRCAPGGPLTGVALTPGGTFSTNVPDARVVLQYRMLPDLEFAGATIYRHATMSGQWSWGVQMATVTSLFVGPHAEICSWGQGCTSRGSATDRFAAQNRVGIWEGPENGFNVPLSCDIPDSGRRCDADGSQVFRLFGGKASLRDVATPRVTFAATGTLVTDAALAGTETLTFSASDSGSGLYRVRATVDGVDVAARVLPGSPAECGDRNTDNADPYEFAVRRPCPSSASPFLQLDTSAWPKSGRLRVYVEDAGRNSTVLVNRRFG